MKNPILSLLLCAMLAPLGARSEEPVAGEPRLPPEALVPLVRGPELPAGLDRLKLVEWLEPLPEEADQELLALASYAEPPVVSASLWVAPKVERLTEGGPFPKSCADIHRGRRQVKRSIRRMHELRAEIDQELRYRERVCGRRPVCDWSKLDRNLERLNAVVTELRDFSELELGEKPDRLLVYRFHLDNSAGRQLLREGWVPAGSGLVTRVRFRRSGWIAVPEGSLLPGGFMAAPAVEANGKWLLSRAVKATEICTSRLIFNMEFLAPMRKGEKTQNVLVRAISL